MMGATPEMFEGLRAARTVDVWPENELPLRVFIAMGTQWRTGMNGPTGLDYAALPAVMDLIGVSSRARGYVFDSVRELESAALSVMSETRKGTT